MKHVSILIPKGHTSLVNIEGTHQIFSEVNNLRVERETLLYFNIKLVGLSSETSQPSGLFTVNPQVLVHDVKKTDLIIILPYMVTKEKPLRRIKISFHGSLNNIMVEQSW
mgnify:CR=1 FL=1